MRVEKLYHLILQHGTTKLFNGSQVIFHKLTSNLQGGKYVVATPTTRARTATSDEWNFKDAKIVFSFQQQDFNYPQVGYTIFSWDWNIQTAEVQRTFDEEFAKSDGNSGLS